jgi:hypothetical protein
LRAQLTVKQRTFFYSAYLENGVMLLQVPETVSINDDSHVLTTCSIQDGGHSPHQALAFYSAYLEKGVMLLQVPETVSINDDSHVPTTCSIQDGRHPSHQALAFAQPGTQQNALEPVSKAYL